MNEVKTAVKHSDCQPAHAGWHFSHFGTSVALHRKASCSKNGSNNFSKAPWLTFFLTTYIYNQDASANVYWQMHWFSLRHREFHLSLVSPAGMSKEHRRLHHSTGSRYESKWKKVPFLFFLTVYAMKMFYMIKPRWSDKLWECGEREVIDAKNTQQHVECIKERKKGVKCK